MTERRNWFAAQRLCEDNLRSGTETESIGIEMIRLGMAQQCMESAQRGEGKAPKHRERQWKRKAALGRANGEAKHRKDGKRQSMELISKGRSWAAIRT